LKQQIIEKDKLIEELKNKNKKLKSQNKNLQSDTDIISNKDQIINLMEELREKEHELRAIKKMLPFDLSPGENLMCVIFISVDQKVHLPVICKNTDIFTRLEKLVYDEYPEFGETDNYFMVHGQKINKYKSLDFNKIKNNDIITLKEFEF
jgi:hypothetical protein